MCGHCELTFSSTVAREVHPSVVSATADAADNSKGRIAVAIYMPIASVICFGLSTVISS